MYESWNCLYQKTGNNVLNLYKKHWPSVWRSRHKKIKKNKKKKREEEEGERERERDLLAKALKALNGNFRREIPWFMPVKI